MSQLNSSSSGPPTGSAPGGPPASGRSVNVPLLLVAVGLGLAAVILNLWYINRVRAESRGERLTVYRLRVSVEPGERLERSDLEERQYPADLADSFANAIDPENLGNWMGEPFYRPAEQGAILTFGLFTPPAEGSELQVRSGRRAATIPIHPDTAPPVLDPGQYVDISAVVQLEGDRPQTYWVMEKVRTIAVGDRTVDSEGRRSRNYGNITVEVEPNEVQMLNTLLAYVEDECFRIVIRSPTDNEREIQGGGINPQLLRALNLEPR